MSGSKKGRKLRPYQSGRVTPVHVHILTPEELAADAWEFGVSELTRGMLDVNILEETPRDAK